MQIFIELELPFCLYMKDDWYRVVVLDGAPAEPFHIHLSKFRRDKEKIEYTTFYGAEQIERGELWRDKHGTFRRNRALVVLPSSIRTFKNRDAFWVENAETICEYAVKAVNCLVEVYRYVTQDYYIPFVNQEEVANVFYVGLGTLTDGEIEVHYRNQMGYDARLTNTLPDYPHETCIEIQRMLDGKEQIPLYEELVMRARGLFEEGNARMSVVEIQTAFEVFAIGAVAVYYNKPENISKIKDVSKLDFASVSKIHLGRAIGKRFEPGQYNYDRWHSDTYLLRNKVVHQGYVPSLKEALDAVLAVENALDYLAGRPKEKSWLKMKPPTVVNEFFTGAD